MAKAIKAKNDASPEARPWRQAAFAQFAKSLRADRVPHALLLVGSNPTVLLELARAFAAARMCAMPAEDGRACGTCKPCRMREQGTLADYREVGLEEDSKELKIDAIRELAQWLSLSAERDGIRTVIVHPADRLNANAANALLKTLEEPQTGRLLLLTATEPARLPATVRSRCQQMLIGAVARDEALAALAGMGLDEAAALETLARTGGDIEAGLADAADSQGNARREATTRDLVAVAGGRSDPLAIATAWAADDARLRIGAAIDWGRLAAWRSADRLSQAMSSNDAAAAAVERATLTGLAAFVRHGHRALSTVDTPVRDDLVIGEWLAALAELSRRLKSQNRAAA